MPFGLDRVQQDLRRKRFYPALTGSAIERFGGLNLADDPQEVAFGGAIDALNIDVSQQGVVKTRPGYSTYLTSANSISYIEALPYNGDSSMVFVADSAFKAGAYQNGSLVGSLSTAGTATYQSFVHIGTPTAGLVYAFNGVNAEVKKWNGSTWSTVTIANGGLGCASPVDNRLVVNVTVDPNLTQSRIAFSDPGVPETFGANNYIDLQPGVSGAITAMAVWQNYIFVFKTDRFYVFYGTSTDRTGQPVFNYRTVYCGVGPASASQVAVGPKGLYFVDSQHGVHVTTGGPPAKIGGLERLWDGQDSPMFTGFTQFSSPVISCADDRLYITGKAGLTPITLLQRYGTLVYHLPTGTWTYWEQTSTTGKQAFYKVVPVTTANRSVGTYGPAFMFAPGVTTLGLLSGSTDNGTAINSIYRSGFSDLGYSGNEKTVRQAELTGTGSVSFGWSRDFGSVLSQTTGTVTLGTDPATTRALHRLAVRGEFLSWQITGSAPWRVARVEPFVRDARGPGEQTA